MYSLVKLLVNMCKMSVMSACVIIVVNFDQERGAFIIGLGHY